MAGGGKRAGAGRPRTTQSDARAFLRRAFEDQDHLGLIALWQAAMEAAQPPDGGKPDPSHLYRLFEAAYGRAPQTTDLNVSGAVRLVAVKTGFSGPIVADEPDADRAPD
jgi:hypothetical protein